MTVMHQLKISVITVVYNNIDTIERAIKSVMSQDYPNVEYIVVDGGSEDGTVEVIKEYSKYIEKWVSEPDNGIYDAMNKGISMASGDVIAFLNSDDWYVEGALSYVAEQFANNRCDILFAGIEYVVDEIKLYMYPEIQNMDGRRQLLVFHPAAFAKKSVFEKKGGFDVQYKIAADYDWEVRSLLYGFQAYYCKKITTVFYAGGVSSIYKEKGEEEARQIELKYAVSEKEKKDIHRHYDHIKYMRRYLEKLKDNEINCIKNGDISGGSKGDVLIFGTGDIGLECYQLFRQNDIHIKGFVDNNISKWGKQFCGHMIYKPDEIYKAAYTIVIASIQYEREIIEQLDKMKIEKERIILYSALREKIVNDMIKNKQDNETEEEIIEK